MPIIIKNGELTTGHGFHPIPAVAGNAIGSVFADGKVVVCSMDTFGEHTLGDSSHTVIAGQGSTTVFARGLPVWRKGDPATCGDTANSTFGTVFADGM